MSKYNDLWTYIKDNDKETYLLSFDEINKIAGIPIDHSFLNYKKELVQYGYQVEKISLKEKTIKFTRTIH